MSSIPTESARGAPTKPHALCFSEIMEAQLDGSLSYSGLKRLLHGLRESHPKYPRRAWKAGSVRNCAAAKVADPPYLHAPPHALEGEEAEKENIAREALVPDAHHNTAISTAPRHSKKRSDEIHFSPDHNSRHSRTKRHRGSAKYDSPPSLASSAKKRNTKGRKRVFGPARPLTSIRK